MTTDQTDVPLERMIRDANRLAGTSPQAGAVAVARQVVPTPDVKARVRGDRVRHDRAPLHAVRGAIGVPRDPWGAMSPATGPLVRPILDRGMRVRRVPIAHVHRVRVGVLVPIALPVPRVRRRVGERARMSSARMSSARMSLGTVIARAPLAVVARGRAARAVVARVVVDLVASGRAARAVVVSAVVVPLVIGPPPVVRHLAAEAWTGIGLRESNDLFARSKHPRFLKKF